MLKVTTHNCDCCGRLLSTDPLLYNEWVSLEIETFPNHRERIDLCSVCCSDRLYDLLKQFPFSNRIQLVNYLKRGVQLRDGIFLGVKEKKEEVE